MAEKRMFTMKIIDSDAFLDMPLSTQTLYFHLNMRADDDGFVNNPRKIQRMIGASDDDLKLLIAKRFILAFENGVIVIKHWRMHNLLRKDRYTPTQYQEQMQSLAIKENGAYTEAGNQLATNWQPDGNQLATQDSIGKVRKDKKRIEDKSISLADSVLDGFVLSDSVKDAIREFIKMRKQMKSPMSDRALTLLINKLREMAKDEQTQVAILNQSIMNGWKSVYPLKESYKSRVGANGVRVTGEQDDILDGIL